MKISNDDCTSSRVINRSSHFVEKRSHVAWNHEQRGEILEQGAAERAFQPNFLALEDLHVPVVRFPLKVAVRFDVDDFHAADQFS